MPVAAANVDALLAAVRRAISFAAKVENRGLAGISEHVERVCGRAVFVYGNGRAQVVRSAANKNRVACNCFGNRARKRCERVIDRAVGGAAGARRNVIRVRARSCLPTHEERAGCREHDLKFLRTNHSVPVQEMLELYYILQFTRIAAIGVLFDAGCLLVVLARADLYVALVSPGVDPTV